MPLRRSTMVQERLVPAQMKKHERFFWILSTTPRSDAPVRGHEATLIQSTSDPHELEARRTLSRLGEYLRGHCAVHLG